MSANKRAKDSRMRGSHTHGWGAKKKHRGSGHRGGKGNAGSGKRSDAKKPSMWKSGRVFGKFGFKKKNATLIKAITIRELERMNIPEKEGFFIVDTSIGYNKLLGSGIPTKKYKITLTSVSSKAKQKIEEAGGNVA